MLPRLEPALAAVSTRTELAADAPGATWQPLRTHTLSVHLAGPDPAGGMRTAWRDWELVLAGEAEPDDPEAGALLDWPSRDTEICAVLLAHGFVPLVALAVREHGRPAPRPGDAAVATRLASEADLDSLTELHLQQVRYDAQFGLLRERRCAGRHAAPRPAARAGWLGGVVTAAQAGYLGCLSVARQDRSGGVGSALASLAHQLLDEAAMSATMLHHTLPNPLSTPFWHRHGYRPLRTIWGRVPAVSRAAAW